MLLASSISQPAQKLKNRFTSRNHRQKPDEAFSSPFENSFRIPKINTQVIEN